MERRFPWFVVALLTVMAGIQSYAAWTDSQTYDEGFELGAGYAYWTRGDFRINFEQPPLQKYWCSLPLLFLHLRPVQGKGWDEGDDIQFGRDFLYKNNRPAIEILFAGRLMTILLSIALGLSMAIWLRRKYGAYAALIALTFYAFEPNLIAHGHYTTTDFAVTMFCFLTMMSWNWYLEAGTRKALIVSGLMLGLAVGSKFSAIFLIPAMLVLLVIQDRGLNWRRWTSASTALAIGFLILTSLYLPEIRTLKPAPQDPAFSKPKLRRAVSIARGFSLVKGFEQTIGHQRGGHPAYLLGRLSQMGWTYYFPIAFAVKTTTGMLLGCAVALIAAPHWKFRLGPWVCLAIAPTFYFVVAITNHVNVGIRHLLPIYPFLCALLGIVLSQITAQWIVGALLLITAAETASRFPYYTAFFNVLCGGPDSGANYLVDSNIDWGQDLGRLKQFMIDHDLPNMPIQYFGGADPGDFGIWYLAVPRTQDSKERAELDSYLAISVTLLKGDYIDPQWYAWLRERTPVAKIGYSIYIYDFREHR